MNITTKNDGAVFIASVEGNLEGENAPEFQKLIDLWISKGEQNVILDLSKLAYVASAGLRCFIILAKALQIAGGKLVFCNVNGMVLEIFTMSNFPSLFSMHASLEEAKKEFE